MKKATFISVSVLWCVTLLATSLMDMEKVCAVCGVKSTQTVIVSTNSMGSADLDLRPPEMMRSTITHWVEKCPACGYCASDITILSKNANETVLDPLYKAQLSDSAFPDLANMFLCKMLIHDKATEYKDAIYSALCAAWVCDDAKATEGARAARGLAIERLLDFTNKGEHYMKDDGGDEIVLADMLRRNGQFEKAGHFAEKGLSVDPEDAIKNVLKFELELIGRKDTKAHQIAEALGK